MTDAGWKKNMTSADWDAVMDKSIVEAKEWTEKNSEHLDNLNEWLDTEVKVVNTNYNKDYDGYIRELIHVLGMQHFGICQCIQNKIKEVSFNVRDFIKQRGLTPGETTAQNLSNLCTAIYELDKDKVNSLHAMLCSTNYKGQSLFNWTAWRILVNQARKDKGYLPFPSTSKSVNPWYKYKPEDKPEDKPEGGGRKLSRRRKSNPKSKSKHKHKRRSYKKSSYRRQRH
jgi:hypothetical protein